MAVKYTLAGLHATQALIALSPWQAQSQAKTTELHSRDIAADPKLTKSGKWQSSCKQRASTVHILFLVVVTNHQRNRVTIRFHLCLPKSVTLSQVVVLVGWDLLIVFDGDLQFPTFSIRSLYHNCSFDAHLISELVGTYDNTLQSKVQF